MRNKTPLIVSSLLIGAALTLGAAVRGQTQAAVKISYWNINTENFGGPAVRELIQKFQEKNPGISVEPRSFQNAYTGVLQGVQAAIAANDPPDVVQVGYLYTDYVRLNLPFVPTTELAKKFNGEKFLTQFRANILEQGQAEGVQVGLPYSLSNTMVYYNADLFKKAGLNPDAPPLSWAAWRSAAKLIKEKTGKFGLYINTLDDNWTTEALMASNGGALIGCQDGTVTATFDSAPAAEALQTWADLVKDGYALNALAPQGEQAFLSGESAAFVATIAKRAALQANAKFDLKGAPFPRFGTRPTRLPGGGNVLVVFSKDAAKQEAAWKFMQYLTSKEGFTIWTKGTGYAPLIRGLDRDENYLKGFVAQNPMQRIGIQQLGNVFRWTAFPGANGLAASQALFKATQRALGGQASAKDALAQAAQEVNALIKGEKCKK
jgi:multiple sugar transport system substrate-binding protein